jgi:hypothetical protein
MKTKSSTFKQTPLGPFLKKLKGGKAARDLVMASVDAFENTLITGTDGSRLMRGVAQVHGLVDKTGRTYYFFGDVHNNVKQCGSFLAAYRNFPHITDVVKGMLEDSSASTLYTDVFAEIFFRTKTPSFLSGKTHWKMPIYPLIFNGGIRMQKLRIKLMGDLINSLLHGGLFSVSGIWTLSTLYSLIEYPGRPLSNIKYVEDLFRGCFERDKKKCPSKYSSVARFHYADVRFTDADPVIFQGRFNFSGMSAHDWYREFNDALNDGINGIIELEFGASKRLDFKKLNIWKNLEISIPIKIDFLYHSLFRKCAIVLIFLLAPETPEDSFVQKLFSAESFDTNLVEMMKKTRKQLNALSPDMSKKIRMSIAKYLTEDEIAPKATIGGVRYKGVGWAFDGILKKYDPVSQTLTPEWAKNVILSSEKSFKTLYTEVFYDFYKFSLSTRMIYSINSNSTRVLTNVGVAMMDLYTLSRMFKPSLLPESKRVIVFAGAMHTEHYVRFLVEEMDACLFLESAPFIPFVGTRTIQTIGTLPIDYKSTALCVNIPPIEI